MPELEPHLQDICNICKLVSFQAQTNIYEVNIFLYRNWRQSKPPRSVDFCTKFKALSRNSLSCLGVEFRFLLQIAKISTSVNFFWILTWTLLTTAIKKMRLDFRLKITLSKLPLRSIFWWQSTTGNSKALKYVSSWCSMPKNFMSTLILKNYGSSESKKSRRKYWARIFLWNY